MYVISSRHGPGDTWEIHRESDACTEYMDIQLDQWSRRATDLYMEGDGCMH
jgi:hypothetical protein